LFKDLPALRAALSTTKTAPIPESVVVNLLIRLMELLNEENNVVLVPSPIYIVGDIHGQLDDLLWMFQQVGALREVDESNDRRSGEFIGAKRFVFMGDYVDRGWHSLNTFLYLATLKLEFPFDIYLLRGNHESRQISIRYGFYHEVILNYGHSGLWSMANDVFDLLPLAALVDGDVFCLHGGLSPKLPTLDAFSLLDRRAELWFSKFLRRLIALAERARLRRRSPAPVASRRPSSSHPTSPIPSSHSRADSSSRGRAAPTLSPCPRPWPGRADVSPSQREFRPDRTRRTGPANGTSSSLGPRRGGRDQAGR
jgi:hypothetical protein